MAFKFCDGFDWTNSAGDLLKKWSNIGGTIYIGNAYARLGTGNGVRLTPGAFLTKSVVGSISLTICHAIRIDALPVSPERILEFYDNGILQTYATLNPVGTISFYVDGNATPILTSVGLIHPGTWTYISLRTEFHAVTGDATIWMDGFAHQDSAACNTSPSGVANGNVFKILCPTGLNMDIDDLVQIDGTGGSLTACNADLRVMTSRSIGVGATTQWTPVGAAANWDCVNDAPAPNADTDYVTTTTLNNIDTYDFESMNIAATTSILGVVTNIVARKTDSGGAGIEPVVRAGGVNYAATACAAFVANASWGPPTTYESFQTVWYKNPSGGGAGIGWVNAGIDAAEFGYKRIPSVW